MSIQGRHPSISQEEEEDERFIQESTELAKSFTEFFINSQARKIKKLQGTQLLFTTPGCNAKIGDTKSPLLPNNVDNTTGGPGYLATSPTTPTTTIISDNHPVAISLRTISELIDNRLDGIIDDSQKDILKKRGHTLWDIDYRDFHSMMMLAFTRLRGTLVNVSGWQVASLVFRGVAGLVRDLRLQDGGRHHGSRAREGTLQSYVSTFLEEIALMTWIEDQGGLVSSLKCLSKQC